MRKVVFIALFLLQLPTVLVAQNLGSRRQPVLVQFQGIYQHYRNNDDSLSVTETSVPLFAQFPLGRRLTASFYVSGAQVSATDRKDVTGPSDVAVTVSYARRLTNGSVVFNLSTNLPSGLQKMTLEEFDTSVLASNQVFDFRVPGFGRGMSISPGVTFARTLSERFVIGMGVSYLVKGSFRPAALMEDDYQPGNELLLTGGIEVGLTERSLISVDGTYTTYGVDKIGSLDVYSSGNRFTGTLQYRWSRGYRVFRVLMRARKRAESVATILVVGEGTQQEGRRTPDDVMLRMSYGSSAGGQWGGTLKLEGRLYSAGTFEAGQRVIELGIRPWYRITRGWRINAITEYTLGSVHGIEAGFGFLAQI